jgi:SAM-dependent methyltransferase
MHKNSRLLFEKYARQHFRPEMRVLEIGPDREPSTYRSIVGATSAWDTLDFASRSDVALTYRTTDEYRFPVADSAYDLVFAAQVIEHVRKVWLWVPELARVCRPGGLVIIINPISWHYHESPVDCWRIYPEGMRALCEEAGLEVVLSLWESVELKGLSRITPAGLRKHRIMQRLSGVVGMLNAGLKFPVEAAYDTITVARRPAPSESDPATPPPLSDHPA